jgi:iron only hydrogenase large subunit-like protein
MCSIRVLLATFHSLPHLTNICNENNWVLSNHYSRLHVQVNKLSNLYLLIDSGWICYAEKTYGQLLIPHLSRVRSPQAIAGALVKNYLAQSKGYRHGHNLQCAPV